MPRKEEYYFYITLGICPCCQKNKIYGSERSCPECRAKASEIKNQKDKKLINEQHREWSKRTHQEMIEKGICTRCRKRKADYKYKTCGICRNKTRNYKRIKYGKPNREDRILDGLCYFCDNKIKPGYKVCEHHYQMNIDKANSNKAKEVRKKLIENKLLF